MFVESPLLTALVVVVVHLIDTTEGITQCTKRDMCSCTTEDGKVIDLMPLSQNPPLQDETLGYVYKWNPCDNFQFDTLTIGSIKVSKASSTTHTSIGFNSDRTTSNEVDYLGNPVFEMYDEAVPPGSYAKVTCVCDGTSEDVTLTFSGESTGFPLVVSFTLTAPHCCPGYTPSSSAAKGGLSAGSVITIIFFSVVVCYFLFGVVFQVAVRKSQGKERMPNVEFWTALLGLIKDGFIFTFRLGKRTGYSQI